MSLTHSMVPSYHNTRVIWELMATVEFIKATNSSPFVLHISAKYIHVFVLLNDDILFFYFPTTVNIHCPLQKYTCLYSEILLIGDFFDIFGIQK